MANRRKFSSAFKAKVAIEALKEKETLAELSRRFEVSQEMISRWKSEFVRLSTAVFDNKHRPDAEGTVSAEITTLRAKVGELTIERDFLEAACKKSGLNVKKRDL